MNICIGHNCLVIKYFFLFSKGLVDTSTYQFMRFTANKGKERGIIASCKLKLNEEKMSD